MATSSSSSSTAPATTASSTTTTTATLDNNNNGEGGILQHADAISQAMGLLLKSPKYSDLTIACQGREFHVHRAIVCPHSRFFDMACSGDFKVRHQSFFPLFPGGADGVCLEPPRRGQWKGTLRQVYHPGQPLCVCVCVCLCVYDEADFNTRRWGGG